MQKRTRVYHPTGSPFASPKARTQQHFRNEMDINYIVERARRGMAPSRMRDPGMFLDVSETPNSLDEAYERIQRIEQSFASLPAKAREELDNDPRKLLRASADFFERHGLTVSTEKPLASPPEAYGESEGGTPAGKPSKGVKGVSKTPKSSSKSEESDSDT